MISLRPFYWRIFIFFCCVGPVCEGAPKQAILPVARKGSIDLRKETFTNNIELNGEWIFNWKQLITPKNFLLQSGLPVNFPSLWNGYKFNGKTLPAFGYATYRLTVLLPKTTDALRISVPDVYSAYRLIINGREVAVNGRISTQDKGFVPQWEYKAVDIPEGIDTLKLLLQVANFAHSKGGVGKPVIIGKKESIELGRERAVAKDLLLTGCLLMGGLFFLGLYLFGNRDKAILLFSLFAMVYSYRMVGTDNYALHTILPHLNWYITIRLEYISLFTGIGLFGFYSRYLYPEDYNTYAVFAVGGICFLFVAATLCLPPFYFSQLINPFLIITIFCLVYVPYLYIKAYRKKREGSVYALASGIVLMCIFTISLLHYWGFIPSLQFLTFILYISFFFLQSLVLSKRVSSILKKAGDQAAEGLIAKSEFLSSMSHEIRTPLNSVVGMSHLLLRNSPREDQLEQLNVMIFSANNLLNIVNDILDYSKIEAGMITFEHIEMDIAAIARNVVMSLQGSAQDKGIFLKLNADSNLRNKVMGDPTRISQVITNLVHNAIKFTSIGGVDVSVAVRDQTQDTVTVVFKVKDTGIGISKEKQALIFERFTQADSSTSRGFGGTGLGLAISKRILELQQVNLQLISEENQGSTFFFVQTFIKSSEIIITPGPQKEPLKDNKSLTGLHILLVDDNPMNVMVAQAFLKRWGAVVDVAVNGLEALQKLDTSHHRLILMDLHMPVMDGYESSAKMRANGVTIPIIALTATLPSEIEDRLSETGIDDILVKPFLPDELYRKVFHHIFTSK